MDFTLKNTVFTPKLTTQGLSYFLIQLLRDQKTPFVVQPQQDGTWRVHVNRAQRLQVKEILNAAPNGMIAPVESFPEFDWEDASEGVDQCQE